MLNRQNNQSKHNVPSRVTLLSDIDLLNSSTAASMWWYNIAWYSHMQRHRLTQGGIDWSCSISWWFWKAVPRKSDSIHRSRTAIAKRKSTSSLRQTINRLLQLLYFKYFLKVEKISHHNKFRSCDSLSTANETVNHHLQISLNSVDTEYFNVWSRLCVAKFLSTERQTSAPDTQNYKKTFLHTEIFESLNTIRIVLCKSSAPPIYVYIFFFFRFLWL